MASWEDGAAYAPIERPDGFATPRAEPLEEAPRRVPVTPGAVARPSTLAPVDAPPLATHGPKSAMHRDPRTPFDVAAAIVTAGPSAPSGHRDPRTAFAVSAPVRTNTDADAPPPPEARPLPAPGPTAPGAVTWHAPQHGAPGQTRTEVAPSSPALWWLGTGMCLTGTIFAGAAPILLTLAGVLTLLRMHDARALGRAATGIGIGLLLLQVASGQTLGLYSLLALVFAVFFLVGAGKRRPPRPPQQGGQWYGPGSDVR